MNTKQKLILGLSSITIGGAIAFGFYKYQYNQEKHKIMTALKRQRFHLSQHFIGLVESFEKMKEKQPINEGNRDVLKGYLLNDPKYQNIVKEAYQQGLKEAKITEKQFFQAVNSEFRNDKDVREILDQTLRSIDLILEGEKNCFCFDNYYKMSLKEFIKHNFKCTMYLIQNLSREQLSQEMINYAKKEGFFDENYHPVYIMYLNRQLHIQSVEKTSQLFGKIFDNRKKQLSENPNHQFDDEKDLLYIYNELGIRD